MLTIEKAMVLNEVDLFSGLPGDLLSDMAAAAEEMDVPAGHAVTAKGERSSAMYVVASGRVRVHEGDPGTRGTPFFRGPLCPGPPGALQFGHGHGG